MGSIEYRVIQRNTGSARISCVVPKNIVPRAVDRHAFKRFVYGVFLTYSEKIQPIDIILRPKRGWNGNAPWKQSLQKSLTEIFRSI